MRAADQVATAVGRSAGIDLDGLPRRQRPRRRRRRGHRGPPDRVLRGLLADSAIRVVAQAEPVDDADRAALRPASAPRSRRSLPAARPSPPPARPYLPVVRAVAADPSIKPVIGLDLLSDPNRAAAVNQATEPRSAEHQCAPRPRAAWPRRHLAVTPLRTPDGRVVGYLSAVFAIDDVLDTALTGIERRPDVAIYDHGERIIGTLDGGAAANVDVGGRTLVVRADDPAGRTPGRRSPSPSAPCWWVSRARRVALPVAPVRAGRLGPQRPPPARPDGRHPPRRARPVAHGGPDQERRGRARRPPHARGRRRRSRHAGASSRGRCCAPRRRTAAPSSTTPIRWRRSRPTCRARRRRATDDW